MKKLFAADFGAGNTCLYCAMPNKSIREASPLNSPGGEPSGYAVDQKGNMLLGLGLSQLGYQSLQLVDSFHINIKARPTAGNRAELVNYFHNWLEKMKKDYPQEFAGVDEPYWFIGCPTGDDWKEEENINLYKSIFEEAGYENVYIIPESNAALAFYQHTQSILDLDDYKTNNENTKLLLIDQGAYSLDATYYSNGSITSYGGYLGASLIERMMIHTLLYTPEETIRMRKMMWNYPPTIEGARALYEQEGPRGKFYTYLLLQARILKEQYFTQLTNKTLLPNADLTRQLDYAVEGAQLILFTNEKMMHNILNEYPIRQVLGDEFKLLAPEVQDDLGNQTWMQAFHSFLEQIDRKYPELRTSEKVIIMLTGGGSLMQCVSMAVKEYYTTASVFCDKEAIAAIGKGMAYWAPDKVEAIEFENAFGAFTDREEKDENGNTVNVISNKLAKDFLECVLQLTKDIVAEETSAVKYGIESWRDYYCSNTEIPGKIRTHLENWCKNTGMPSFISNIENHIDSLKTDLNADFSKVTQTYHIDEFVLMRKDDKVFLSNCRKALPKVFDAIVELIESHYVEHPIWSLFPNEKKKLFSNPRLDFYNGATEVLNEWLDKEMGSTINVCSKVFLEMENKISDELSYTYLQLFQIEGKIDLLNLMEKHVKEILGKLVLEEYIE